MRAESAAWEGSRGRACYVDDGDRYLFAWHHAPRPGKRRGAAVVLCAPLGSEYICVYRVWRVLAERLAENGFDVLRFDYEGTGESSGALEEPGRVEAWSGNIARISAEARKLARSADVALIGLRIGATLAFQAAAEMADVDRLVLWAPFRSGRAYVRELKAFSRLCWKDYIATEGPDILAAGYVLPGAVADAIERVNLDNIAVRPAARVLILDRDDRAFESAIGARFEALGSSVDRARPAGTAAMLEQPWMADVPHDALDAILSWLDGWKPTGRDAGRRQARVAITRHAVASRCGYKEQSVRFGPDDRLFGLVTVPDRVCDDAPALILLNTGLEYRVGPHRLYVPLARDLATRGHLVFRYDIGGIGDSLPPAKAEWNIPYPAHALDDVRAAIACVKRWAPQRRVIVAGLCSGAWHAFCAARDGLPIDAIVAVNAPLYLREGCSWAQRRAFEDREGRAYRRKLRDPASWRSALQGRSEYGRFAHFAAAYLKRKIADRLVGIFDGRRHDGLAAELNRIRARGVECLFVFSTGDAGLTYFEQHARPALRHKAIREHIKHMIVEGAGHSFSPPEAQQALQDILAAFISGRRSRDAA